MIVIFIFPPICYYSNYNSVDIGYGVLTLAEVHVLTRRPQQLRLLWWGGDVFVPLRIWAIEEQLHLVCRFLRFPSGRVDLKGIERLVVDLIGNWEWVKSELRLELGSWITRGEENEGRVEGKLGIT